GTALLDMALYAAEVTGYGEVAELVIGQPLTLPAQGAVDVQVQVTAAGDRAELTLHSRPADDTGTSWTTHATGTLTPSAAPPAAGPDTWPPTEATGLDVDELYARLTARGFRLGPQFRTVRAAWQGEDTLYVEAALPDDIDTGAHRIHPALLDALCQLLAVDAETGPDGVPLGSTWHGVRWESAAPLSAAPVLRMAFTGEGLAVTTPSGVPVASAASVGLHAVPLPEGASVGDSLPVAAESDLARRGDTRRGSARRADPEAFVRELREQDDEARARTLLRLVREQVAQVLGHAGAASVDADKAFSELGFDSMAAVEVRNRLSRHTGLALPSTLVFDHPTARRTAVWLDAELRPRAEDGAEALLGRMSSLETLLSSASPSPEEGDAILAGLESLLQRWRSRTEGAVAGGEEAIVLDDASDDELFAVLDGELGGG
ncbi:polyketide synthase dehydratase domain-containing protein, partial [Streptomyces sp. NPDC101158]|uniref:polyketide synthase dehydratase domain-containing protein n=1 Tax=Streptomyces sp. NPDC101158 TaxID=3366117 RepID=UPI0037F54B60